MKINVKIGKAGKYILSVMLVVCMVSAAFLMPDFIMHLMDERMQADYSLQSREGIDYEAIETEYEWDRGNRLNAFANGIANGNPYYIISTNTDSTVTGEDFENLCQNIMSNDLLYYWIYEIAPFSLRNCDLITKKDFCIYDGDITSGETILCSFLEFVLPHEAFIRFLVDSKDYTIYYVEIYNPGTDLNTDAINTSVYNDNELFFLTDEGGYYFYRMLYDYYCGSMDGGIHDLINILGTYDYMVEEYDRYDADTQTVTTVKIGLRQIGNKWNGWTGDIGYEDGKLTCAIYYVYDGNLLSKIDAEYTGVCVGIKEIMDLLPQDIKGSIIE